MAHSTSSAASTAKPAAEQYGKYHTIALLVENHFGAFNRIAGLFAAKG